MLVPYHPLQENVNDIRVASGLGKDCTRSERFRLYPHVFTLQLSGGIEAQQREGFGRRCITVSQGRGASGYHGASELRKHSAPSFTRIRAHLEQVRSILILFLVLTYCRQKYTSRSHGVPKDPTGRCIRKSSDIVLSETSDVRNIWKVTLNGKTLTSATMQQMSTFVEQEDALLGVLTVRESVTYALRLQYVQICNNYFP